MNFLAPARLLIIAAPILLAVAYLAMQHRRQEHAVRFASLDLLASVLPRRSGWQRHIAPTLFIMSLVALIVGFARPTHTVRVARERGTVILAIDTSASMGAIDVAPNRISAAQQAARDFINGLPAKLQVGLLSFDKTARVVVTPTADRVAVTDGVNRLVLGPGTATGDAIFLAAEVVAAQTPAGDGTKAPAVVVLMSDGTPTLGRGDQTPAQTVIDAIALARRSDLIIDTIAYGTVVIGGKTYSVPSDPIAMNQIASGTNGRSFAAEDANQLKAVYDQIRSAVGYDQQKRELTVWFTGLGLLAAILAASAALIWSQRLI